jgi:hypothetical protein
MLIVSFKINVKKELIKNFKFLITTINKLYDTNKNDCFI